MVVAEVASSASCSLFPSTSRNSVTRPSPKPVLSLHTTNRYLPLLFLHRDSRSYGIPFAGRLFATKSDSNLPTDIEDPNQDRSSALPTSDKKSFAVVTGELFLAIASRLIRSSDSNASLNSNLDSTGDNTLPIVWERSDTLGSIKNLETDDDGERIATAVQDSESGVLWEQRVKDVEAEEERRKKIATTSPGFSFSAAGLLFPYHLGVASFLIENGYINETTPLAGSSAGAIVCAVIASGASMKEALDATKILAENCRKNGTAFRLGAVLRDILTTFLPEDVHIRSNGRVRVAVTQLLWRPVGLLVDQFDSKEDLINAIFTSSFIPGYLAPKPATRFRNKLCIDGGLTLFMPPTSAEQTVRVCAFPVTRLGLDGIGISPDCNPQDRPTPRQLFDWALEPADDYVLDKLFEFGYRDAAVWAKDNPLYSILDQDR